MTPLTLLDIRSRAVIAPLSRPVRTASGAIDVLTEQGITGSAYLLFLEQQGWLASAADIERRAIQAGRNFSKLRFPPD